MGTPNHVRQIGRRNARLLADNALPPAPKNPVARTRGVLAGNGKLQRHNSTVERKRVPEEVGCTVSLLDWKAPARMKATGNSKPNMGMRGDPKFGLQHGRYVGTKRPGDTRLRKEA